MVAVVVQKTGLYYIDGVIRKLTPIECERLQGLPADYTEGVSDTQRYKCIGNAFNVDVVSHILTFLKRKNNMPIIKIQPLSVNEAWQGKRFSTPEKKKNV